MPLTHRLQTAVTCDRLRRRPPGSGWGEPPATLPASEKNTQRVRIGLRQAVVAVIPGEHIVDLRYRPDDTPIPVVVCKGSGAPPASG